MRGPVTCPWSVELYTSSQAHDELRPVRLAVVGVSPEGEIYRLSGGNQARPGREQPNPRRQRSRVTGWRFGLGAS